jgi:probable phosphoglycerate mutase
MGNEQAKEHHRLYYEEGIGARDVVIVAHGHFNRVMIARWLECDLPFGTKLNVEPGGVSVIYYECQPITGYLNRYCAGFRSFL